MTQQQTGWLLILAAAGMLAINVSDAFADLESWHGATTPQFFAVALKQTGMVIMAALGGKLLPSIKES